MNDVRRSVFRLLGAERYRPALRDHEMVSRQVGVHVGQGMALSGTGALASPAQHRPMHRTTERFDTDTMVQWLTALVASRSDDQVRPVRIRAPINTCRDRHTVYASVISPQSISPRL